MDKATLNILEENGLIELRNASTINDLIAISYSIGHIIDHPNGETVNILRPKSSQSAVKGSFSSLFGYGSFPFHTDTAFWPKPARYMLLCSFKASSCDTTVVHFNCIWEKFSVEERKEYQRATFRVKTIHGQFYTSLRFSEEGIVGYKYDPACMIPVNMFAKIFTQRLEEVLPEIPIIRVNWTENKVVLIDNWKMMHGREEVSQEDNRELLRIYIN